jgi:hypothetical protein
VKATNLDVFYPLEAMISAKRQYKLYYKYDGHWAVPGAMVTAKALINYLHAAPRGARI